MLLLMIYQKTNAAEIVYLLENIDVVILIVVVVIISLIYDVILRSICKRDTNAKITDEKSIDYRWKWEEHNKFYRSIIIILHCLPMTDDLLFYRISERIFDSKK